MNKIAWFLPLCFFFGCTKNVEFTSITYDAYVGNFEFQDSIYLADDFYNGFACKPIMEFIPRAHRGSSSTSQKSGPYWIRIRADSDHLCTDWIITGVDTFYDGVKKTLHTSATVFHWKRFESGGDYYVFEDVIDPNHAAGDSVYVVVYVLESNSTIQKKFVLRFNPVVKKNIREVPRFTT